MEQDNNRLLEGKEEGRGDHEEEGESLSDHIPIPLSHPLTHREYDTWLLSFTLFLLYLSYTEKSADEDWKTQWKEEEEKRILSEE